MTNKLKEKRIRNFGKTHPKHTQTQMHTCCGKVMLCKVLPGTAKTMALKTLHAEIGQ